MTTPYNTAELTKLDQQHFTHPWTVFDVFKEQGALPISRGDGCYIEDSNGRRYLDAVGGLWCTNIGLGRTEMADAIAQQCRELAFANPFVDMTNVPATLLAAKLAELAPGLPSTLLVARPDIATQVRFRKQREMEQGAAGLRARFPIVLALGVGVNGGARPWPQLSWGRPGSAMIAPWILCLNWCWGRPSAWP